MKVELLKPHTHDDVDYKPGDIMEIDDELGAWLVRNKIAKKIQDAGSTIKDNPESGIMHRASVRKRR